MAGATPAKDEAFGIVPIYFRNNTYQFLLIQHLAGHWGFPKGHADPGEDAVQAACREFVEETGISAYTLHAEVAFSEQYDYTREGKPFHKIVIYYPAIVTSQTVACQPEEIRDYAWLDYEAAIARLSFEGAKRVLGEVKRYLEERESDLGGS
jgi:8-oxo-dGTP pyrophosphatase MutT (NUDIX family)